MKVLIDMNLSPDWCDLLVAEGWEAVHWSAAGDPGASDRVIMSWAARRGFIVLTHDLDFGSLLAVTQANSPSVVQLRAQDVLPDHAGPLVVDSMGAHAEILLTGALMVIDAGRLRVRILPLGGRPGA